MYNYILLFTRVAGTLLADVEAAVHRNVRNLAVHVADKTYIKALYRRAGYMWSGGYGAANKHLEIGISSL